VGAEGGVARVLQYWELCKPRYLTCTPGFAEHIIDRCPELLRKPASELGMKGLMCAGEPGSSIPEVRKLIMEGLNLDWFSDFIGGAHNFHGYCCDADQIEITRGMHLASEDYCILELLDLETQQPLEVKDGAVGEMCFTYLEWEGTPLLRYRLGDVLQVFISPCDCGDPRLRFRVIGRVDDMLIIKGVNLYPAALKNFVAGFIPKVTGEFRILLDIPGPRIEPPLRVQIEYGEGLSREDLPALENEIMSKAHQVLRVSPRIEFVPPNTLERAMHKRTYIMRLYENTSS
jgi:phenylacetate-CoA ligase